MLLYPVFVPCNSLYERKHPLEGIWTAIYSTHGKEILQFSIVNHNQLADFQYNNIINEEPGLATYRTLPVIDNTPISTYSSTFFPTMPEGSRLLAHKLTGDYNIPADTDSFLVYLDSLQPIGSLRYPVK